MRVTSKISSPGDAAPRARETALRWRRTFDGDEAQVREVRRWLSGLLPECPARDDVAVVASELCANAIAHTASGRGGIFAVEITWQGATVRVAVADAGAPNGPYLIDDPTAERGRGLLVVQALCSRTGVSGGSRGRLVWGEVLWPSPPTPPMTPGEGYEAAIRDGLAGLAHRHQDVLAWFGRSTLQWWAVTGWPGAPRLVTAPTPAELGDLIDALEAPPPARPVPVSSAAAAYASLRARPDTSAAPPRSRPPRLMAGALRMRPC
jgi:anti-sigma regulatory factor (Ser/Thr protein kinase)